MSGKLSVFAGFFNASDFAYGINNRTSALLVNSGAAATGSGTLVLVSPYTNLPDGTILSPLATTAPINVGSDSGMDTSVTPTSVSITGGSPPPFATSTVTASFTYLHGSGDQISSATCGLQEAINYANLKGGGTIVVDAGWTAMGGTQAMIAAATLFEGVEILDNRAGFSPLKTSVTLTNAQILTLSSTPVELLPPPGVGAFYNIVKATLINECTGTAYASGGVIEIGYGTAVTTEALSGTIAATFLTSPTVTQVIQLAGVNLASTTEALYDNQPIYINNATGNFTTGTGTLKVSLVYTVEGK